MSALDPIETDALVIGAGPAGLFQVFQLGLLGIASHIVDALPCAGGQCIALYADKPIYDIPGTPVTTGRGLVESLLRQVEPFAPRFHFGQQIARFARAGDARLLLTTSTGACFRARTVFIAAGLGAFVPKRVALPGIESFEGRRLFYHPESLAPFAGQRVIVNGGDDAALQAALALMDSAASVTLVHRRDVFQADDATVARLRASVASDAIGLVIGQIRAFDGTVLQLSTPEAATVALPADALLAYLGLSPRLGPIADWGLAMERKQLRVHPEDFQTSEPGVFAVGDINTYPGKKKLIVCAFHEATLAAWGAAAQLYPGQVPPLQYTTTNTRLRERLGGAGPWKS
ncbi:MAG: NAD(P)/FAD-dependent oxidoreductase [Burkholderiaceae bacterium]|nr:NAD(P)/FAD-dependent oxidoreductase [Burkholderiaceae bacterium]